MVVAKLVVVTYDPLCSGSNCRSKAITTILGATHLVRLTLALLLFVICSTVPVKAATTNILTCVPTDLVIDGPGYLVVHDPVTGQFYATRLGGLMMDPDGYLVTYTGMRVQGFTDPALTVIGDLQIPGNSEQNSNGMRICIVSFEIQTNGNVMLGFSDGTSLVRCQILLQNFVNPSALTKVGDRLLAWSALAGPLPQPAPPGSSGTGWLLSGTLEQLVPELQLSRYTGTPCSFTQGILVPTGIPTDLGIEGNGFFVLRRTNDNALFATRAGAFYLDGAGFLVHYSGLRLQGYQDSALTVIGDVLMDTQGLPSGSDPSALIEGFDINRLGVITLALSDPTTFVRGQILLQNCLEPSLVTRTNFDLYPIDINAGLWSPLAPPLTGNLGRIVSGAVELSQFDTNLLAVRSNLNFFPQGYLIVTGIPSNLGIGGTCFFTVRDPVANALYATRCGSFQLDALNRLVTTNGMRVQGLTDSDLTQGGDIIIDAADSSDPALKMIGYFIDLEGHIRVVLSDGSQVGRGRILLQNYRNPQALKPVGNGLYSNLTAALPMFTNGLAGYVQLSTIYSGGIVEQLTDPQTTLQLPPASGFRLLITDLTTGTVQASNDLLHWDAIGQVNGSDLNEAEFFDAQPTTQRFYRVVANP